jgi:mannosyltransferase OCH1-like enzyme
MGIPKIIHQTWKTDRIPEAWQPWTRTWRVFHPDWQYRLWADEDNRRFVETHYPDFIETYEGFSYNIQRADAVRYLILYKLGGLYVDLDFECLRPVNDLLAGIYF